MTNATLLTTLIKCTPKGFKDITFYPPLKHIANGITYLTLKLTLQDHKVCLVLKDTDLTLPEEELELIITRQFEAILRELNSHISDEMTKAIARRGDAHV